MKSKHMMKVSDTGRFGMLVLPACSDHPGHGHNHRQKAGHECDILIAFSTPKEDMS